jgi:AcrR family transcriptional regulator
MTVPAARVRSTAPERREQIVDAALRRFAEGGLHGTSTEDIAADTGLSQPYLFRLFGTKRDLFLACCEACHNRIRTAFTEACTGDTPDERLSSMGRAYNELLTDEVLLRFQLQTFAASGDPDIRATTSAGMRVLLAEVQARSGVDDERLRAFFATGMLLNVATMLQLDEILDAYKE